MLTDQIKAHTYKEYLCYDEGERIEIIEGEIYNMSPASSRIHQEIIMDIFYKYTNVDYVSVLQHGKCIIML